MSTATAKAYNYSAISDTFSYWPEYGKAQKTSGFWANRTHGRCIKDYVLIDPCMGSGHVLVYMFDVLMQIYISAGWSERDATESILENNLYGLDIDDRAGQLAYFAVMMKSRRHNRRILSLGIEPNVMSIQDSSFISDGLIDFVAGDNDNVKRVLVQLKEIFIDAKEYGSILIVPKLEYDLIFERLNELKNIVFDDVLQLQYKKITIEKLQPLIKQAMSMSQKYDVVVTNPPYMSSGSMNSKLSEYVKCYYDSSKADLYAVLIEKSLTMTKPEGFTALITQHTWMFIASYVSLRRTIYHYNIINLVHLGIKAFEEIGNDVVQTCAFVFRNKRINEYSSSFVRLVDFKDYRDKQIAFFDRKNRKCLNCDSLQGIPGSPLAYWVGEQFISNFNKGYTIEKFGDFTGSQNITGDNEKYLRYHWEVSNNTINKRWFFYAKGGDYRQYYGNLLLVVDWSVQARLFYKNNKTSNLLNEEYWYKPGITYSAVTSRGTGFRYMPENCIFDKGGPSITVYNHLFELLALLNSNVAKHYFWVFNPSINLQVKDVKNLPILVYDDRSIEKLSIDNTNMCKDDWNSYEVSPLFKKHPLV